MAEMKARECVEGPEALRNFEQFASAILQAPKPEKKKNAKQLKATSRKSKNSDRDQKGIAVSPVPVVCVWSASASLPVSSAYVRRLP